MASLFHAILTYLIPDILDTHKCYICLSKYSVFVIFGPIERYFHFFFHLPPAFTSNY